MRPRKVPQSPRADLSTEGLSLFPPGTESLGKKRNSVTLGSLSTLVCLVSICVASSLSGLSPTRRLPRVCPPWSPVVVIVDSTFTELFWI